MADLTKKYRLIWDFATQNIQNDYTIDYSGFPADITDEVYLFGFDSDNYQDILNKIEEKGLHPIGEWIDFNDI